MPHESIRNLVDRLKQQSDSERAKLSAAARASAAQPTAAGLRYAIGARVRDLVTGQLGDVVDAQRDAPTRWERYRVRLANASEVFRHERELELAARIVASLICFVLYGAIAAGQASATLAWGFDGPPSEVTTFTQAASVDGVPVTGPIACVARPGDATKTDCSAPTAPLAPGKHTLTVAVTKNGSTATTNLTNFDPANGPKSATTPRYNVTITISLP